MTPEEAIRALQGMQQSSGDAAMTHAPTSGIAPGSLSGLIDRFPGTLSTMGDRLLGQNGQERYQLWPERAVRAFGAALTDPLPEVYDRDAYVKRAADLNLLPMSASAFMRPQAAQAGVFAGAGARTADRAALEQASNMHLQGASRGNILENTGWFLGPDKKWRYEISDENSRLMPNADRIVARSLPVEGRQAYLPDVLEHPDLFKAYPELSRTKVWPSSDSFGYSHIGAISMPQLPPKLLRDLMLHEVQHEVQGMENFAIGGPHPHFVNFGQGSPQWKIMMDQLSGKSYFPDLLSQKFKNPEAKYERMTPSARVDARAKAAEETYRRSAGEAEAYATQARTDMPAAQRREYPNYPWVTMQKISGPEKDWIIRYLEGGQR